MPTPAERKALLFLAGVILLGASVRVVRAARDDGSENAYTRAALTRQLEAVDSAHKDAGGNRERRAGRATPTRRPRKTTTRPPDSATTNRGAREGVSPARTLDTPAPVIDLDVATEADIESLPRIGPVLARRVVEDRAANGPFGSLEGFERVRGVGPALAAGLRGRVTFSGTARPSNAVVDHGLRSPRPPSKSARRERRP